MILSILWRYGLCVILVALAVIFTLLLQKAFSTPFWRSFFFVWVVIGSTWFLGKGPGFMAVVLSTLAVDYYFTPPFGEFSRDPGNLPFVVVFFIFALVSGFVSSRLKDRETALGKARDELEERVRERTKELEKSNILLLSEIEERERAEEGIRKLNEELEARVMKRTEELGEVNRELEAFAYSVSHDLRAPLRHLAGYAELLQKSASSGLDEKSARYVAAILESAKRMGELIDDLLSFSRTSRAEIKKSRVSLEQLVNEILGELRRETDGRMWSGV